MIEMIDALCAPAFEFSARSRKCLEDLARVVIAHERFGNEDTEPKLQLPPPPIGPAPKPAQERAPQPTMEIHLSDIVWEAPKKR